MTASCIGYVLLRGLRRRSQLQVDHGMFVYPASVAKPFKMVAARSDKIAIESLVFDIGQSLDAAGSLFFDSTKSRSGIPTGGLAGKKTAARDAPTHISVCAVSPVRRVERLHVQA